MLIRCLGCRCFRLSHHARSGPAQVFSEFVATFGLMTVIWGCSSLRANAVPFAEGAYITAAYWFTPSTSFANPAVTLARGVSETFSGIRSGDLPARQMIKIAQRRSLFFDRVQRMNEPLNETFTRKEIQERFRKMFDREMTPVERRAFFLPPEPEDKTQEQGD